VGSATLLADPELEGGSLLYGGFPGQIFGLKMSNQEWTQAQLDSLLIVHPQQALRQQLNDLWTSQGCLAQPDPSQHSELLDFLQNNQEEKVRTFLKELKKKAKKGDDQAILQCYGGPGGEMFRRWMETQQLYDHSVKQGGPQCLPTAPFECPTSKDINDFDIRTHRDFHRFIEASQVRPPGPRGLTGQAAQTTPSAQALITSLRESQSQSQAEIASLQNQLRSFQEGTNLTKAQVERHPAYQELVNQLVTIQARYAQTQAELSKAQAGTLSGTPERSRPAISTVTATLSSLSSDPEFQQLLALSQNSPGVDQEELYRALNALNAEEIATKGPAYQALMALLEPARAQAQAQTQTEKEKQAQAQAQAQSEKENKDQVRQETQTQTQTRPILTPTQLTDRMARLILQIVRAQPLRGWFFQTANNNSNARHALVYRLIGDPRIHMLIAPEVARVRGMTENQWVEMPAIQAKSIFIEEAYPLVNRGLDLALVWARRNQAAPQEPTSPDQQCST
jgi:hypothetical protein